MPTQGRAVSWASVAEKTAGLNSASALTTCKAICLRSEEPGTQRCDKDIGTLRSWPAWIRTWTMLDLPLLTDVPLDIVANQSNQR